MRPILPRLRALGLSVGRFASLTGYHPITIYGWGKERSKRSVQTVPPVVLLLLDQWERHPGEIPASSEQPPNAVEAG